MGAPATSLVADFPPACLVLPVTRQQIHGFPTGRENARRQGRMSSFMLHEWLARGPLRDVHRLMGVGRRVVLSLFRFEGYKANCCRTSSPGVQVFRVRGVVMPPAFPSIGCQEARGKRWLDIAGDGVWGRGLSGTEEEQGLQEMHCAAFHAWG